MLLKDQPPGIYACWVYPNSTGFFVNKVTSNSIYCLYESFADKALHYEFSDIDYNNAKYHTVIPIDSLSNCTNLKSTHPELFL